MEREDDLMKGNIRDLDAGVYILKLIEGGLLHTIKFIKE